jgi:hypothetical protein
VLDHFRQARLVPIALCILGASCGDDSALNPDNSDIYTTPQDSGRGPAKDTTLEDTGPAETPPGPAAMPYVHGTPTVDNFDHSLCYYFCHFNSHCSINFGGKAECYDSCHKMIADGKSANVACFVANCMSEEECLEDIPIPKACDDLCVNAGECPALAVLGMTPSPELCRVTCAGRAKAIPSFNDALECMVAPLRQCNLDAALECLADGATFCPLLCLEVADNPNFEREIDPECPWSAVYPTKEACFQHCSSMNAGQAFRAMKCFEDHECETTMACIEAPTSACAGYVEAVSQHCPATAFWPPSVTLAKVTCQEVFQGEFEGFPENLEMFPNCLETLNCNIDNRYVCLLPPDPRCEAICTAISDCGIFEYPECYGKCGSVSDPSDLDVIETCVSVSTCVEIEKCIDSAGQPKRRSTTLPTTSVRRGVTHSPSAPSKAKSLQRLASPVVRPPWTIKM